MHTCREQHHKTEAGSTGSPGTFIAARLARQVSLWLLITSQDVQNTIKYIAGNYEPAFLSLADPSISYYPISYYGIGAPLMLPPCECIMGHVDR